MMLKQFILTLTMCCFLGGVFAQKNTASSNWKFISVNQVGLLQGESKAAFHLQTVNGFAKSNWFAGAGIALDYYRYRSIPLFAETIKYFGKTNNNFFVYADAGIDFVWEKANTNTYYREKYSPGFYGGAGIGYKTGFKNGIGFLISAGYSYKRINDKQSETSCPFVGPCYAQSDYYKYDLNRLLFQIGWMF